MRTIDFTAESLPNGQITVPPEVASQVPPGEPIEVAIQLDASDEDQWRAAGRRQFEAAYSPDDSVYETLANSA